MFWIVVIQPSLDLGHHPLPFQTKKRQKGSQAVLLVGRQEFKLVLNSRNVHAPEIRRFPARCKGPIPRRP